MCGSSTRKKRQSEDESCLFLLAKEETSHQYKRVKRRGEEAGLTDEELVRWDSSLSMLRRRLYGVKLGYQCGPARMFEDPETEELYDMRWMECNWNKTWTPVDHLDPCK